MLIYSMSVSVDGFIADREGAFEWTGPDEELFGFHLAQVRELGCYLCGRRLYETMLVWETDPSLRENELRAAFADVWCALPKVVFTRTLDIGLSFLLRCASPLVTDRETRTHRRVRSKRSYGHLPAPH